ncbi:hypothetical protein HY949_01480 [Candidatus Gottesmanbacteria bacterium]|nr:hypothetical protein [Candidatus Gottesmanbacteria bacterium]
MINPDVRIIGIPDPEGAADRLIRPLTVDGRGTRRIPDSKVNITQDELSGALAGTIDCAYDAAQIVADGDNKLVEEYMKLIFDGDDPEVLNTSRESFLHQLQERRKTAIQRP